MVAPNSISTVACHRQSRHLLPRTVETFWPQAVTAVPECQPREVAVMQPSHGHRSKPPHFLYLRWATQPHMSFSSACPASTSRRLSCACLGRQLELSHRRLSSPPHNPLPLWAHEPSNATVPEPSSVANVQRVGHPRVSLSSSAFHRRPPELLSLEPLRSGEDSVTMIRCGWHDVLVTHHVNHVATVTRGGHARVVDAVFFVETEGGAM
jgi:hypothetical protein